MTAATTVLMNRNRCGVASPAAMMTPKIDQKKSSTVRAAPAVQPSLKKPPAVAPQGATKPIRAGIKTTTNAPAAWRASGPAKPRVSVVPTLDRDVRNGMTSAAAVAPRGDLSVLRANPHHPVLKMRLSAPAAVQRRTGDAPARMQAPRATPDVPPNRHWPRTAPAATANPPAAHGRPREDHGTTAPASTTEPIASLAADPAHQPGAGGLQQSVGKGRRCPARQQSAGTIPEWQW